MSFTHLHVHTEYSLLDGSNKITEYVRQVKALGMDSAAITDHGVMYGVIDFYKAAKAEGIKPILGCEVYVAPGSRFDKSADDNESKYYHLILLAENNEGYSNLMKIVSAGFVDGFYYKPRVDREILTKYHEGIICLSACLAGEVARLLQMGQYEEAKKAALWHRDCFGEGNYFLELQDHGIMTQQDVNQGLLRISQETGIELVATNDVHYTFAEDEVPHDILLCIQTGKKVADEDRMRYEGGQYYVKSEEEMRSLFPYAPQAIDNTVKIADRCNVDIEFGVTKLPHFEVPEGYDSWTYLNKLCKEGLERRYPDRHEELLPNLEYELDVIRKMGYVDYFLIVWDFINFAREHDIPVGPGRGSAAGSLVSYTTGITDIDPIKYSLLFERFLNPERVSMPDIDIDFSDERRGEVIDYVVDKYGKDCVTQIVTFGTLAARNVIRDVGRVLDLPYAYVDKIAKSIPRELKITIKGALEKNPELLQMYNEDETVKHLLDMAMRLEGLPRNTSMHAAGVVISQKPMEEYVPLARAQDGTITTQFVMTTIEELGLLKMDFLGLRTLSVIDNAIKMIESTYPDVSIDFDELGYDDKKVFDLIGSGETDGIFQLESTGMKNFMKDLKPERLEDVIAGISLYRPGPMDFIPEYLAGKGDKSKVTYLCPQLKPILEPTYGCIVYQEQVMQIVRDLAGYSMGRSDLVRRAMSKKKDAVMQKERANFVYGNEEEGVRGCINNGISEDVANEIYDKMIDFAKYAFNKSHAAAYAVVAYQTAYLKCYYPLEFMASLMSSVIDNTTKVSEYIFHCKNMGINVLPPNVNSGEGRFSVDGDGIRYGMYAIKSVGRNVIDRIVAERNDNGLYTGIADFITRVNGSDINKRAIENLIKAGALDGLDANRRQMLSVYVRILDSINSEKKKSIEGQMSFLDIVSDESKKQFEISIPNLPEYDKETILEFEKEALNIYISGHPLEGYQDIMKANVTNPISDLMIDSATGECKAKDNSHIVIGGMITNVNIKYTSTNKTMAFITVEDLVGQGEVIVFPDQYERNRNVIKEDAKVLLYGRVNAADDKDAKLICEGIVPFEEVGSVAWVIFDNKELFAENENKLYNILGESQGTDRVCIFIKDGHLVKELGPNKCISIEDGIVDKLRATFGNDKVRVQPAKYKFNSNRRNY